MGRGVASTHTIVKVSGAAKVRTRSVELHVSWNSGFVEAEADSGRRTWAYRNRPRYALVLPLDADVDFRIREKYRS